MPEPECDLCSDTGPLTARSVCHPTAPLRAVIENGVLTLRCYIPACDRLVARFQVVDVETAVVRSEEIQ